jgi:hypothetical protein
MQTRIDAIAADTLRIRTLHRSFAIRFDPFLVRDDEPFLVHAGMLRAFESKRDTHDGADDVE